MGCACVMMFAPTKGQFVRDPIILHSNSILITNVMLYTHHNEQGTA